MTFKHILAILVCLPLAFYAQKIKPKDIKKHEVIAKQLETKQDSSILSLAEKIGDGNIQLYVAYKRAVNEPDSIKHIVQIANLYFNSKQYALCINTCNEILKKDTINKQALELTAISFQALKRFNESKTVYRLLYKTHKNPNYLYQVAQMEYVEKDYKSCIANLQTIVKDTNGLKYSTPVSYTNKAGKPTREVVSVTAAAFNMAGYILLTGGKYADAKKNFEKAIKLEPKFGLAVNNLIEVEVKLRTSQAKPVTEKKE